ncbi:MAG: hypothetical protein O6650_09775 [Actinobacteria bacterium]|nr:hypothetical protein [Actinomycetota bacterium]
MTKIAAGSFLVALILAACGGSAEPEITVTAQQTTTTAATTTTSSSTTTTVLITSTTAETTTTTLAAITIVIEAIDAGSGMDVFTKTFLVGQETAYAPGFSRDEQVVWYAGTIVHDSCHSRLYSEGESYIGRDSELACMLDQLDALEALDRSEFFESYVQGLIDGVDDPENAYWNDPDRHW